MFNFNRNISVKIKHQYLKDTTIVTHLGTLSLDENGMAEVPEGTEIVHPDLTIIQDKTDNPVKKEEKAADTKKTNKPATKQQTAKPQAKPEVKEENAKAEDKEQTEESNN